MTHIPAHPENDDNRRTNPNDEDIAIFLADAVAERNDSRRPEAILGDKTLQYKPHTVVLRHIQDELITHKLWHIRQLDGHSPPFLGSIQAMRHISRLQDYTTQRDEGSGGTHWKDTSFPLAHALHPPLGKTSWQYARRAVLIFNWLGHGANRAKVQSLTPAQIEHTIACRYCGVQDSQEHCIIHCPHPAFSLHRTKARKKQHCLAVKISREYKCPRITRFAQNICHYSWHTDSQHIRRLWLGTWSPSLFATLLAPQTLETVATMDTRSKYIKIAARLTKPLLTAYRAITKHITAFPYSRTACPPERVDANARTPEPLPLMDHLPPDNHVGSTDQHTIDTLGSTHARDLELSHIHHIHSTSALLISPTAPTHMTYDYTDYADLPLDLESPDDGRIFDS